MDYFAFEGDSDEEIECMSAHRNIYEKNVKFTKNGIIEHFNTMFERYSVSNKGWDIKNDKVNEM